MITEKRWLLYTSNERILKLLKKFEGVEEITDDEQVEEVWSFNKTPVVNHKRVAVSKHIEVALQVPEWKSEDFIRFFEKWAHAHGFECGEFKTGEIVNTREESCVLCAIGAHKGLSKSLMVYNENVPQEMDCIIYESAHFFVTSELGALKRGYLMIIPKEHDYLSIAQLPGIYRSEYQEVCRDVECILKGAFGDKPVSFFEHGSGPSGLTSHKKSIVHAHTHVVIDFVLKQKYLNMLQMKRLDDLSKARETHYFAYKVGADGKRYCCYDPRVYVQRQFPRQVMAMELGYTPEQYNWRKYKFEENMHTTLYYLYKYLSSNKLLNPRIAERTKGFVDGYARREDFEGRIF